MGRYYTGDIEGKFWFAVQDSDDACHFGGLETEVEDEETGDVTELLYEFSREDLDDINEGIETCVELLGDKLTALDEYFGPGGEGESFYNPDKLARSLGFAGPEENKYLRMMENYARLHLGKKIKECVERIGHCNFSAEL